jgi:GT2 family glycosyltransferase
MQNIDGEIIVIDNHSTDGSFTFFQNRFQEVHFIWNEINSGFAKANNKALAIAQGEYILFLNPDTIVPEDCFERCIAFINDRPKENSCALGIKMLDGAGNFLKESKRAFPSPLTSFYKLSGLAGLFSQSKKFGRYYLGYLDENKNHEVDVLAGAFMMVPKFILNKIGGFDESFFMYGEDIDLSFRIQKAGYKNCYFAGSCIIHFKGESTKKGSLNYVKLFYRAMSIFVKKHYRNDRARLFSFFIHTAIFIRASLSALHRLLKWIRLRVIGARIIAAGNDKYNQIIIVGNRDEFKQAIDLLGHEGSSERIIGRIETHHIIDINTVASFDELKKILKSGSIKKIIFCEGQLTFKKIIQTIPMVPKHISIQLFSRGSHAIIGSDDKDAAGNFIFKKSELPPEQHHSSSDKKAF